MITITHVLVVLLVIAVLNNILTMRRCPSYYNTPSYITKDKYDSMTINIFYKKDSKNEQCTNVPEEQIGNNIIQSVKQSMNNVESKFGKNIFVIYR